MSHYKRPQALNGNKLYMKCPTVLYQQTLVCSNTHVGFSQMGHTIFMRATKTLQRIQATVSMQHLCFKSVKHIKHSSRNLLMVTDTLTTTIK